MRRSRRPDPAVRPEGTSRLLVPIVASSFLLGAALALLATSPEESPRGPSTPASPRAAAPRGGPTYRNPILFADWSDPDVIRVGDDYWLVASSFHEVPGLPILHSRDLVHWTLAGHAAPRLPSPRYDVPRHGGGVWAPSIRYDDGSFQVWYGDPDLGIFTLIIGIAAVLLAVLPRTSVPGIRILGVITVVIAVVFAIQVVRWAGDLGGGAGDAFTDGMSYAPYVALAGGVLMLLTRKD